MVTYRFTNVSITDHNSQTTYLNGQTATVTGGEDVSSINEVFCKCTTRPEVTGRGDSGRPRYTIDGTNPSALHVTFDARCTSRGNDPFVGGSTVCTFEAF